jgi:HSP20 family protein
MGIEAAAGSPREGADSAKNCQRKDSIMSYLVRTNGNAVTPRTFINDPFFASFFGDAPAAPEIRLDVEETTEAYVLRADLPGVAKDQINVEINDDLVSISVEYKRETTTDAKSLRVERLSGKASRSLRLPVAVDATKADAKHVDGVLTLTLPKAAPTARRLTIN